MAEKKRNNYVTVERSETIDKDRLHAIFDRSTKSIEDYLSEYQYVSDYQTYKSMSQRIDHRYRLMDLYDYLMQDAHLSSIIDSLFQQILGERYYFVDEKGEKDEEATKAIGYSWFTKLIRGILESKPFGYTLVELGDIDSVKRTLKGIDFVERRNVAPRDNMVLEYPNDTIGWDISSKDFARDYVLVDGQEGYGLLLKAAPLVIAKRYSIGAHLHNAETYGVPFIHAKAEDETLEGKMQLAGDVARAGRERIIVTGMNDSINLLQQLTSDTNKIYTTLIDMCNSELSKLLIGQTGTTESMTYAGSADIMFQVYQNRVEALREFVVNIVNEDFVPRLVAKGMKQLEGRRFTYSNNIEVSPDIKVKMYDVLLKHFEIDPSEIEKEFGIKVGEPKINNNLPESVLLEQARKKPKGSRDGDGDGRVNEDTGGGAVKVAKKKIRQASKGDVNRDGDYSNDTQAAVSEEVNFLTRIVSKFDAPVLSALPLIEEVGAKYGQHYRCDGVVAEYDDEEEFGAQEAILVAMLRDLFDGRREAAIVSSDMVALTASQLIRSFEEGYGVSLREMDLTQPENAYYRGIVNNLFNFAGAKTFHVLASAFALRELHRHDFGLFREEALRIHRLFNKTYANVERGHASFSGEMARFWRGIEDPETILEYVTMADHRVRETHAALHGIRRRASDPFWTAFFPPWEYGCRCKALDAGTTNGQRLNMDRPTPDPETVPEEFRFNVGTAGFVFNRQHSYFAIPKRFLSAVLAAVAEAKRKEGF